MKSIFKYIALCCACGLLAVACETKELTEYKNDPRIYFTADSINYSFYMEKSTKLRDTLWFGVRAMGMPEKAERTFRLKVVTPDTVPVAIEGVHYIGFDDPEVAPYLKISAEKAETSVPLIVLRDSSLQKEEYVLDIALEANENFRLGINTRLQMRFKITDRSIKPRNWDSMWKGIFGEWGNVKMKFIIDHLGITDFASRTLDWSEREYYRIKIKGALQEYNATHTKELTEADGTKVTFPNSEM